MKIAYIYTALTSVGGADRVITDKANYFADISGYEVYVITDSQAGRSPIFPLSKKVNHINLDVDFSKQYNHNLLLKIYYHFLLMRKYEKRLSKTLKKIKCDIVISTLGRDINFITTINDGSKKIAEAHTVKSNLRNLSVLRKNGGFNRLIAYIIEKK